MAAVKMRNLRDLPVLLLKSGLERYIKTNMSKFD